MDLISIIEDQQKQALPDEPGSLFDRIRRLEESNSALIAIQNKLERLSQFHAEMVLSYDIYDILEKGLAKFQELVRTKVCSVFLVHEHGYQFVNKSIPAELAPAVQKEVEAQIQSGTFGRIMSSGMPACVPADNFRGEKNQPLSVLMAPLIHRGKTIGVVVIIFEEDRDFIRQQTLKLLYILAGFFSMAIQNAHLFGDLKSSYFDTIRGVANSVEARDPYTKGHSRRVARIARSMAEALNWTKEALEFIDWGGMLHDVGKIGIHDKILNKTARLEDNEFETMKMHPVIGAQIVEGIGFLKPVVPYILEHHERYNGNGYPRGLVAEQISIEGRLLAVADVFDAMTTDRPYQRAFEPEVAFNKIVGNKKILFDPLVVQAFEKVWQTGKIQEILDTFKKA